MIKLVNILKEIQVTSGIPSEKIWSLAKKTKDLYGRKFTEALNLFKKFGYSMDINQKLNIPEWLKTLSPSIRNEIYKELQNIWNTNDQEPIDEIQVRKQEIYKIPNWAQKELKRVKDEIWEYWRHHYTEDTADALYLTDLISNNGIIINGNEIDQFLKSDDVLWDGDKQSLIDFLRENDTIE